MHLFSPLLRRPSSCCCDEHSCPPHTFSDSTSAPCGCTAASSAASSICAGTLPTFLVFEYMVLMGCSAASLFSGGPSLTLPSATSTCAILRIRLAFCANFKSGANEPAFQRDECDGRVAEEAGGKRMCAKTSGTLQKQQGRFPLVWTTLMHKVSLARDKHNQRSPQSRRTDRPKVHKVVQINE